VHEQFTGFKIGGNGWYQAVRIKFWHQLGAFLDLYYGLARTKNLVRVQNILRLQALGFCLAGQQSCYYSELI
jgi:hypothetical protein